MKKASSHRASECKQSRDRMQMTQGANDAANLHVSRNTNCPRDHDKLSHQGFHFIVSRRRRIF